jgi:hypothetical protein
MGLGDPAERSDSICRMCQGDPDLLIHCQQLLESHSGAADATKTLAPPSEGNPQDSLTLAASDSLSGSFADMPRSFRADRRTLSSWGTAGEGDGERLDSPPDRSGKASGGDQVDQTGNSSRKVSAMFEAKRQALAMMDHPNIAEGLDGGGADAPASL